MKRSTHLLPQITLDTPPRERILAAARELFYQQGIRAVGVDTIAEAALTNKMTLYRHFGSKDVLVSAYLQTLAEESDARWHALEVAHPNDYAARLEGWLAYVEEVLNDHGERGCAMANAAVELPEFDHPARQIIDDYKTRKRQQLVELFQGVGYTQPAILADEVFLLFEGARIAKQCCNAPDGPASRLIQMLRTLLKQHRRRRSSERAKTL